MDYEHLEFKVTEKEQYRVFIASPAYNGEVSSKYTESLLITGFLLSQHNIEFQIKFINNQIITRARNMLSHLFMKGNFTHMLFIDADIAWNPQDVLNLLSHDEECVVGIYPNKRYFLKPKSNQLTLMPSSKICVSNETKGLHLQRLEYAASGFMLLRKSALQRIQCDIEQFYLPNSSTDVSSNTNLLYNYFDCNVVDGQYLTEDFYFSHLFNKNGGKIFFDKRVRLIHIGKHEYGSIDGLTHSI